MNNILDSILCWLFPSKDTIASSEGSSYKMDIELHYPNDASKTSIIRVHVQVTNALDQDDAMDKAAHFIRHKLHLDCKNWERLM